MDSVDAVTALALVVGLVLVPLVEHLLRSLGLATVGVAVWVVGYGGIVLAAWYVWLRPLEFRPPGADDASMWKTDRETDREPPDARD